MKKRLLYFILPFLVLSAASPFYVEKADHTAFPSMKKKKVVQKKAKDSLLFLGEAVPIEDSLVNAKLTWQIDRLKRYSHYTALRIKKAHKWFPLIEMVLEAAHLPEDFKYLVVVESNFKNLTSPRGAVGFWQIMPRTARALGLKVNGNVDERLDPIKSTHAAVLFFEKAHASLGSFTNVAAAYNMGVTGLKRVMSRQKENSYYRLRLNKETAQYLYKALAFKMIYENQEKHGFEVPRPFITSFIPTRDVVLTGTIDLRAFAKEQGIRFSALKDFNPWFKKDIIETSPDEKYVVRVPVNKAPYAIPEVKKAEDVDIVHVVKQNESLIGIANQYDVDLNQLMTWNELTSEKLELGQKLGIYITK